MINSFSQYLQYLIRFRTSDINQLSWQDKSRLIGRYLLEADFNDSWEFIANTNNTHKLPYLLGEFLLGKRNGPYALQSPEITLCNTMAEGAVDFGEPIIEKAWIEGIQAHI